MKGLAATFAFTVVGAVFNMTVNSQAVSDQVRYRFTGRKFLFAECLPQESIDQYWPPGSGKQKANTDPPPEHHPTYWGTSKFQENCVVWKDIMNNKTRGHPDFESSRFFYADGTSGKGRGLQSEILGHFFWEQDSPWRNIIEEANQCQLTKIVDEQLVETSSGISTLSYFQDPERSRNGECIEPESRSYGQPATTGHDTFSTWYTDDPAVNRRAGFVLTFNRATDASVPTYVFDSDTSGGSGSDRGFFPLDSVPRCLVEGGVEDCSNGGKLWPMSRLEEEGDSSATATLRNANSTFGFTTEYHGHFQYRGLNESFQFAGDDDLYVFINNKLAVDLGGLHIPYRVSIELGGATARELGLQVGGIYSLDIFHAERHSYGSNFKITTSLVETCNVQKSGSVAFDLQSSSLGSVAASGHRGALASQPPRGAVGVVQDQGQRRIVLSDPAAPNTASWVFVGNQFNVGAGFVVDMEFSVEGTTADAGFALVFHRRPEGLDDINGGAGGNLGFRYLTHSMAVAFDFCVDRGRAGSSCDQHSVAIHYPDSPDQRNSHTLETRRRYSPLFEHFKFGHTHRASVVYYAKPSWIEVYLDDSLYLVVKDVPVESVIGGRNAYIGFTGSSGREAASTQIHSFTVNTVNIDPSSTTLVVPESPVNLVANGQDTAAFVLQTRDLCLNIAENGGRSDLAVGALVPEQSRVRRVLSAVGSEQGNATTGLEGTVFASIVDKKDGTYSIEFQTEESNSYDLVVGFGNCVLNPNATSADDLFIAGRNRSSAGEPDNPSTAKEVLQNEFCWLKVEKDLVTAVPYQAAATESPTIPIEFEDNSLPTEAVIGIGIAGGSFLCCGVAVIAYMILMYRNRWKKDAKYVEKGKMAKLEGGVNYNGGDELSVVNRELLNTNLLLASERAKGGRRDPELDVEISELAQQKQEITEQVRQIKMRRQQQLGEAGAPFPNAPPVPRRRQFLVDPNDSQRDVTLNISGLSEERERAPLQHHDKSEASNTSRLSLT